MKKTIAGILALFITAVCPIPGEAACMSVQNAQMILKQLNYFPDAVDGTPGPATMKSIRTFQADYDLKPTGKLDRATCAALKVEEEIITRAYERKKQEALIQKIQERLTKLNYYQGPASGKKSDIPPEVLVLFQEQHQLEPTGMLDGETVTMMFGAGAHEKKMPAPSPAPMEKPAPPDVTPKKPSAPSRPPTVTMSMGGMRYQPKSLYDSSDYEARHRTLNPEQAVSYESESFVMTRMTVNWNDDQFYLATSRLAGGDNAADALGLSWRFDLWKRPYVVHLDYTSVESDAVYDNRINGITTRSLNGEWLVRYRPGLDWGVSLSHDMFPTLVSGKTTDGAMRAIRFDEDFQLNTFNLALRYTSLVDGKKSLFGTERLVPYLRAGVHGGLAWGRVSEDVLDALSRDLDHSLSGSLYRFNLKVTPEIGVIYTLTRRAWDLKLTLGYGLSVHWPVWELPLGSDDEEVRFYRRNVSHGPILGVHMLF